jgi:hypothetical protein
MSLLAISLKKKLGLYTNGLTDAADYRCELLAERTLTRSTHQDKMKESNQRDVKSMAVRQPRYSKDEFAQRGNTLYESNIRSQVEESNHGKIVAIDIETGAFEVADTSMAAVDRLYEREPDAQPWVIRIGHRSVFRFGSRSLRKPA